MNWLNADLDTLIDCYPDEKEMSDMERLTIDEVKNKLEVLKDWVGDISLTRQDMQHCIDETIQALDELQKYRDLEEQGRLIELPCKVGECYVIPKNGTWVVNGVDIIKVIEDILQEG